MTDLAGDDHGAADDDAASGFDFSGLTAFRGQPSGTAADDIAVGTRLGDTALVRLVGEGGMGRVYEALQGMPCRTVAVKVIHPGVLSPIATRRFEHEAQILGRLSHPGIARIYSAGVEQLAGRAVPYLVMEYIDDALPLTAYAAARDLSLADRLALFREICLAVAHGHQKGVVHRDLKPGNVLVDATGRPKVIDFGVARYTDQDAALTTLHTAGGLVGTLQYMAPEQFDGAVESDARADVYSLGVLLFELLTGSLPYDLKGKSIYEAARIVTDVDPQPLSIFGRRLRGDLEVIVGTCLEKDRARRYFSATDLESDLDRHLRGEPIAARRPRLFDGLIRLARRHRFAAAAAAGMVAAVAMGLVGVSVFAVRAESARQEAVRQAGEAAKERELADSERKRADAEAATARQRLYVANLQALQASLHSKNLRLARQLHAENVELVGLPLPLEMHCFTEPLDEAALVIEPNLGPISRLAYASDASRLAAAATVVPEPSATWSQVTRVMPSQHLSRDLRMSNRLVPLVFTHVDHLRYSPTPLDAPGWVPHWAAVGSPSKPRLAGSSEAVEPLAISPDGSRFALPAPGGRLRIVSADTGRELAILEEHRGQLRRVEFAAGGHRLATLPVLGTSRILRLWDPDAATPLATVGHTGSWVRDFCFSPDGSRLAVETYSNMLLFSEVLIYDVLDGRRLATVRLSRQQFHGDKLFAFSTNGRWLVTSSDEPDLHVWNAADGVHLATLEGSAAAVRAVAFSPDDDWLATGEANGHVRVWNTGSWSLVREYMGHSDPVTDLAFSPDGEALASGSLDGTIRIWPPAPRPHLAVLPGVRGLAAVAFRPDGGQLAVAARESGVVELWNPHTVERVQRLEGPEGIVTNLAYAADGLTVAAAFADGSRPGAVCVWDSVSAAVRTTLEGHEHGAASVAFSPDGTRLLTTSRKGAAITWDLATGNELTNAFTTMAGPFMTKTADFGLDGTRVVCRSRQILDAVTGAATASLPRLGQVACVTASPDGRTAAIGVAIGHVHLVDVATGTRHATLVGHGSTVRAMAFNAGSDLLATGSLDGMVRLWRVATGTPLHVLNGHEGFVDAVLFTPDGRRVVSAANDGTVRIWDAERGHQVAALPGQHESSGAIAITPDGMHLVTADTAGTVRIWGLSNASVTSSRAAAAMSPRGAGPAANLTGSR